ncbi:MAG TPA: hypothetical protein VK927_11670, partial [Adhaeribacter sp.]|nr:hypothetical protein [Adhaeribacter sp.]
MKKLKNYYFALMAIASLGLMTSCGDDNEPNPKATIGLTPNATAITAAPGEKLNVTVQVTSADKLKEFKVMKSSTGVTQEVTKVTSFPSSGYEYLLNDEIPASAAENSIITYTITATTNKDEVTERTITVTVKSIETYTAKIMGNQNASVGSFFSATDGRIMTSAEAKASSGMVDILFYHSSPTSGDIVAANNAATIASPTDPKAQQIYNNATTGIQTWA